MTEIELLTWVRGPGLQIACAIFIVGVIIRLFEIYMLGRKTSLAEAKGSEMKSGLRAIISKSFHDVNTCKDAAFTYIAGYGFHIGFFVTVFLFAPHIPMLKSFTGITFPSLPSPIIDAVTVVTIITLFAILARRLYNPVLRFLTNFGDIVAWLLTVLPLITGYLAFHNIGGTSATLLTIHIISVELLLVFLPFTKLTHAFTIFISRWYSGAISGYRGVD